VVKLNYYQYINNHFKPMLDFYKLAKQFPGVSEHLQNQVNLSNQRLKRAQGLLEQVKPKQDHLRETVEKMRSSLIFSPGIPVEPIDTCVTIAAPPVSHSVFATDGSQIAPSQHETLFCYLINIGQVMLHYGQNLHPLLDSLPEVYYKAEDLYVSKQWGIRLEDWMSHKRTVAEAEVLSEMACNWVRPPGAHDQPNLAMVDGPLIYRFIDELATEARQQILDPIMGAWEEMRVTNIPFIGYISASRSMETVNFLRLSACTYSIPNCLVTCGNLSNPAPCQVIDPLRDTTLWADFLKPGQRGAIWQSCYRLLDLYDDPFRVYFCYVNVGSEIARVEFPAWVANNPTLLEQSLGIMLAQVNKGFGYPVALAESHNQAVVKGGDRALFFSMLEQEIKKNNPDSHGISRKESRKRESIA